MVGNHVPMVTGALFPPCTGCLQPFDLQHRHGLGKQSSSRISQPCREARMVTDRHSVCTDGMALYDHSALGAPVRSVVETHPCNLRTEDWIPSLSSEHLEEQSRSSVIKPGNSTMLRMIPSQKLMSGTREQHQLETDQKADIVREALGKLGELQIIKQDYSIWCPDARNNQKRDSFARRRLTGEKVVLWKTLEA
nr:hypothetical protein Iba_chr08bCG7490 [Ipomoea batatas]